MKKNLKSIDLHLIANLILSVIVLIMGIIIMIFKAFGLTDIILYVSILFYIFAFFSIIAYFIKRREGDYELLLLSLINIIVATYMFVFQNDNLPMILGSAMTVYTILMVANRGYKVLMLKNQDNFVWTVKFIMTFLLAFVGILTTINLFNETTVQTMMMGYYFISTGVLMTIESAIELFVTDRAFNKIVSKLIDEEPKELEEIKEEVVVTATIKETPKKKVTGKSKKEETKVIESTNNKESKKVGIKKEEKKAVETKKKKKNTKTVKDSMQTKEKTETKKAGRPKKEAAMKESKKSEIKIVEKKKAQPKVKKEVKVTKNTTSKTETKASKTLSKEKKETSSKKPTSKVTNKKTTTKKVAKETTKKPGRPKKISSK